MKKRGIVCFCLAIIMLIGVLPGVTIASASDRTVVADTGGVLFTVAGSGLVANEATYSDYFMTGSITIRTGTSIDAFFGDSLEEASFLDYFGVSRAVYQSGEAIMLTWSILPGNLASVTFNTPGRYFLVAFGGKGGGIDIHVVGEGAPPQHPPVAEQPSSWAVDQVNAAVAEGLVPQNLQSNYTQATTRAEFAALAVYLYENQRGTITGRSEFADTNDVNVQKAAYIGVVQGVGNNRFAPNDTLTREQAAVMLARLANAIGQPLAPSAPTFADNAQVSDWATQAVGQMQASGIMGGVGDNRFAPSGDYTREQSIVTIMRLFEILE